MKRFHLFEFEDKDWYPDFIRRGQTDFLRWLMETFQVFKALMPLLKNTLKSTNSQQLVDLCSGGGGSIWLLREYLKKEGLSPTFILTDLYPNQEAFELLKTKSDGQIDYYPTSVDATNIPKELNGFFTMFNAFHHFQPAQAQSVLTSLTQQKVGVGIFEPLEKSIFQFVLNTLVLPILQLLATPFIRPFRWDRIIFTYLIPLIPICTLWDGWVSVLRLYPPKQMQKMAEEVAPNYHWEAGKARHTFGVVCYLIGYPKN